MASFAGCSECFDFLFDCECAEPELDLLISSEEYFADYNSADEDLHDDLAFSKRTITSFEEVDLYRSVFIPYQQWVLYKNIKSIVEDQSYLDYPPRIFVLADDEYLIIDGHHRIAAALISGKKTLKMKVQRHDI